MNNTRYADRARRACIGACMGVILATALSACAVVDRSDTAAASLDRSASWTVLPITNQTETPQAGQRAAAIAQSLLSSGGVAVTRYPGGGDDETLFDPAKPALAWAKAQNIRYALTGTVTEWRYKVGVDGEPAVGLTFDVVDVASGKVVWSAAGSRTGWSRDALSGVAQKLEKQLLGALVK
jgi:polysaccharide biosynthesis protein PelC